MTLSQQLAVFAATTLRDGAPAEVQDSVRARILDIAGLQAAALELDTSLAALEFVAAQGGVGQAHVTGLVHPVPASWAAFANGVLAHSLDYDDTHLPSVLHPSAAVVPAAVAMAELTQATGAQLVIAAAVGIEVVVRLGMAGYDRDTGNSMYFEHGQHATSICGTLGAAVAAAMLLGMGEDGVAHTLGVAASMASGILEANRTGGTVKRLHCGWAAHAGVTAASMVQHGFTGAPTALEGRFGFFEAFLHGAVELGEVTAGLGTQWELPGIFFKPYPANHFTHTGIDAALRLRDQGLRPEHVEQAVLGVAGPTVRTIGQPLKVKQTPETGYQAQFSGPYTVTAGLFGGSGLGVGLDDFTDALAQEPARRAVMARVRVEGDADCDGIYPYQFPAVLTVRTRDGSRLTERVMVNRGGPDNPLTEEELTLKFTENACRSFPATLVDDVAACAATLTDEDAIAVLATAFARPPRQRPAKDGACD